MPFLKATKRWLSESQNNNRMKFYIMWANHNVDYLWDTRNSDSVKNVSYGAGKWISTPFDP